MPLFGLRFDLVLQLLQDPKRNGSLVRKWNSKANVPRGRATFEKASQFTGRTTNTLQMFQSIHRISKFNVMCVADVTVPESKRRGTRLKAARGRFEQDVKRMSEGEDILMLDRLGKEGYACIPTPTSSQSLP